MATVAQIDAAIDKIINSGQSYRIGDRTFNRANLSDLRLLRDSTATTEGATSNRKPRVSRARMSNGEY